MEGMPGVLAGKRGLAEKVAIVLLLPPTGIAQAFFLGPLFSTADPSPSPSLFWGGGHFSLLPLRCLWNSLDSNHG